MHLKTTIIDADILKHEGKGAIFSERTVLNFLKNSTEREKSTEAVI